MIHIPRWLTSGVVILTLFLAACAPVTKAQTFDNGTDSDSSLAQLWIDLSIGPELVEWYNQTARPNDIARADHVSLIDVLDQISVGRRLVVFKNISDAEQLMPHIADRLDIIGYNLEHGPSNRPEEQRDPVGSVQRMRALADAYDKELALGPDRTFALEAGPAMAPFVDIFVLQVQRAQTEPQVVQEFVLPMVRELRQANPELEISVQVRTEGDMAVVANLLGTLEEYLDGVSILTSQDTYEVAEDLVSEMRPPAPVLPTPLAPTAPSTPDLHAGVLATPTASMRRVSSTPAPPTGVPELPAELPTQGTSPNWLVLGALVALGVIVSGLIATVWIYSLQGTNGR